MGRAQVSKSRGPGFNPTDAVSNLGQVRLPHVALVRMNVCMRTSMKRSDCTLLELSYEYLKKNNYVETSKQKQYYSSPPTWISFWAFL